MVILPGDRGYQWTYKNADNNADNSVTNVYIGPTDPTTYDYYPTTTPTKMTYSNGNGGVIGSTTPAGTKERNSGNGKKNMSL